MAAGKAMVVNDVGLTGADRAGPATALKVAVLARGDPADLAVHRQDRDSSPLTADREVRGEFIFVLQARTLN